MKELFSPFIKERDAVKRSKPTLYADQLQFLGMTTNEKGLKIVDLNVEAIKNYAAYQNL